MDKYKLLKTLIDSEQSAFSLHDISAITDCHENEFIPLLACLCDEDLIYKEKEIYHITDKGRIHFANTFSRNTMILLLFISFLSFILLYILSKLI